jgi:hypothetical protein
VARHCPWITLASTTFVVNATRLRQRPAVAAADLELRVDGPVVGVAGEA